MNAIILLSGGIDSAVAAGIAISQGYTLNAISFNYEQSHFIELNSAYRISKVLGINNHVTIPFNIKGIAKSLLLNKDNDLHSNTNIPTSYTPARNTIFLSFALSWAETLGINDIFIGANKDDNDGYPDCRNIFFRKFEELANTATWAGVENKIRTRLHSPLLGMNKPEIIQKGIELGIDLSLTHTCYVPVSSKYSCGKCSSCLNRLGAFKSLGITDPILYANT